MKNQKEKKSLPLNGSRIGNHRIISVVVPSINKTYAILLILTKKKHDQLVYASTHRPAGEKIFAMAMDSNVHHDLLETNYLHFTRKAFDLFLRDKYNGRALEEAGQGDFKVIK